MITRQSQIKINLSVSLKDYLASRASRFDMPIAGYVRYLILKDVADLDFPVFQMSKKAEQTAEKAFKERSSAKKVVDVSEYLKQL